MLSIIDIDTFFGQNPSRAWLAFGKNLGCLSPGFLAGCIVIYLKKRYCFDVSSPCFCKSRMTSQAEVFTSQQVRALFAAQFCVWGFTAFGGG
jgi:hypothetical protein